LDPVPAEVNVLQINTLPVKAAQLKRVTDEDRVLAKVCHYIVDGWPKQIDPELKIYFNKQEQLTVEVGCILCGVRVIKNRKVVQDELHLDHPDIIRMKSLGCLVTRYRQGN